MGQVEINVDQRFRAGSLSIAFRGRVGSGSSSDIALDDLCIANGPCGEGNS